MNLKFKLPLLLLFFSVFLTSSLAVRFPNQYEASSDEHWQCLQRCRSQRGGLLECIDECEGKGGSGEWVSEGDDELVDIMINPHHDREHQFEQCRRKCQRQGQRGQSEQWQCQRRCQEKYQERESDRGGRRYGDRDDEVEEISQGRDPYSRRDPQQRFEQCQQRCRRHGQIMECQRMCQEELRRQKEEHQSRRFEEDGLEVSENPQRDPQQRFKQCQQRCQRKGQGIECQKRCQEELQRQREERQGGRYEEGDLEVSGNHHRDPQQSFKQCQQRCQRQGQSQRIECQRRCQKEYQGQEGRGRRYTETFGRPTILAFFLKLTGLF